MSQERIEAAAKAMSPRVWGPQVWTFAAHGESPTAARARVQRESLEQAQTGLEAADAVMFSDEAMAKAQVNVWAFLDANYPCNHGDDCNGSENEAVEIVRLVVAALKGDA